MHLKELPEEELLSQPSAWMRQLVQHDLTRLVGIHAFFISFHRCNPREEFRTKVVTSARYCNI